MLSIESIWDEALKILSNTTQAGSIWTEVSRNNLHALSPSEQSKLKVFLAENPSTEALTKSINELCNKTRDTLVNPIWRFEENLSVDFMDYVAKYPSETLYQRLTKIHPGKHKLWLSYAKFVDKEKGREILKAQWESFKGSKTEFVEFLVENALFEESNPAVAWDLFKRMHRQLPKALNVSIEYAGFEGRQTNSVEAYGILEKAM